MDALLSIVFIVFSHQRKLRLDTSASTLCKRHISFSQFLPTLCRTRVRFDTISSVYTITTISNSHLPFGQALHHLLLLTGSIVRSLLTYHRLSHSPNGNLLTSRKMSYKHFPRRVLVTEITELSLSVQRPQRASFVLFISNQDTLNH